MSTLGLLRAATKLNNVKILRPGVWSLPNISKRYCGLFELTESSSGTMSEIKVKMMKKLGLEAGYVPKPKTREHLLQYEPKLEDLPPRSMQDSFTTAIIPLSQSKSMQDKYVATLGHVRLGRLMEDMDLFAVWVCHEHLKIPSLDPSVSLPYTFVTILVDKIDFTDFSPIANEDIRLSGHVSWVGKSSMEIVVWLEQIHEGTYKRITRALFLMGARNAINTKSAPVNPLQPANEHEALILSGGESRLERRKQLQSSSFRNKDKPNSAEQDLMHDLFMKTTEKDTIELNARVLPKNGRWLRHSSVVSTISAFPENRNAHNTVFGGFLMRNALEISWVCASKYCGTRPKLESVCDIRFQKAIKMSSFLKMNACVVYTENNYIQLMVIVDILDAATAKQITSNVFSFTYKSPVPVAEALPRTYDEMLCYIDGRRKLKYALTTAQVEKK